MFSADYLGNSPDEKAAARKMLDNAIIKCTTSGFLTGFGGLITLPVTLPASVTSVIYVQIRMIASIAYLAGLACGYWSSTQEIMVNMNIDRIFKDEISDEARERMLKGWKKAVGRSFDWNEEV